MSDTLYLIRHARPDYPDGEQMCLGRRYDLPICAEGEYQARRAARKLADCNIERVYSSPLLRARQTAQIIAGDAVPVEILPDLTEMDGGDWDGMRMSDIRRRYPACFDDACAAQVPPNGETDESGLARALRALETIRSAPESVAAAIAHSAIARTLIAHLTGMPMACKKRISYPYTSVALLKYIDGGWIVMDTNLFQIRERR